MTRAAGLRPSSWIRPNKRRAIYARDGYICVWCGHTPDVFTLDHLFPAASPFRDNHASRVVTACRTCNLVRKDTPVAAWLRRISMWGFDVSAAVRRLSGRHGALDRTAPAPVDPVWVVPPPPVDYWPVSWDGVPV